MNKVSEYLPRWLAAALQGLLVLYIIASEDIFENQDGTLYWLGFVVSVLALAVMIWHLVRPDKVEIKLLQLLLPQQSRKKGKQQHRKKILLLT